MSDELKPCPMCGGTAHITKGAATENVWPHGEFHRVFCGACQLRQLFYRTSDEAVQAWNRRTAPVSAPIVEELPPKLPKPHAYMHVMDSTEGIKGNKPCRVLSFLKLNPFGQRGIDYSRSFPLTREPLYTGKQVEQIVTPYAARIRQLERELAERASSPEIPDGCGQCPRDTPYGLATCGKCMDAVRTIDSPEFREMLRIYDSAIPGVDDEEVVTQRLIAYIDGRTAGTAPDGWREFIEGCAQIAGGMVNSNRLSSQAKQLLAAAPTPKNSGKEEAND